MLGLPTWEAIVPTASEEKLDYVLAKRYNVMRG